MPEGHEANAIAFAEAIKMQITQPDVPISDVAGYLDKLREERGWCESEEHVAELRDAHSDMLARLSEADRARAEDIINGGSECPVRPSTSTPTGQKAYPA